MPGPPLTFPGSRALAGWWRQLGALQPRRFWVAHLFFHRVEALVRILHPCPLDRLSQLVLQGLARRPGTTAAQLDDQLHLGRPVLRQVLRGLETHHLAQPEPGECWTLTPPGRDALERGEYPHLHHERRIFPFLHSPSPDRPPHFLKVSQPGIGFRPAGESWTFNLSSLEGSLHQSAEWKQQHDFPREVEEIVREGVPEWQRVIVDHPAHIPAGLVLVPEKDGGERLVAFAIQPEGWLLNTAAPAFELGSGWEGMFPELAAELPLSLWQQAWRAWCSPRGLPLPDVQACTLEKQDYRLRVRAGSALVKRLQAARSDALKGEAWVLGGEGPWREAALLDLEPETG